jgi:hypothetical protein
MPCMNFSEERDSRDSTTCAYRKSNPAILMVQSAQDRAADDIPGPLNAAMDGGTRLVAAR